MNYRLVQHYANKFPEEIRPDIFQEGCVAILEHRYIYHHMIDQYRSWTKGKYNRWERCHIPQVSFDFLENNLFYEENLCHQIYLKEVLPILKWGLTRLKPRYYKIIYLRYWEGLTLKQIGSQFGTSESNISFLHKKALKRIRFLFIFKIKFLFLNPNRRTIDEKKIDQS